MDNYGSLCPCDVFRRSKKNMGHVPNNHRAVLGRGIFHFPGVVVVERWDGTGLDDELRHGGNSSSN